MRLNIPTTKEVNITHIKLELAVRYEEEDIPNDFPLRVGDMWIATVDLDTGHIANWPRGKEGAIAMKVCDEGTYTLYDSDGNEVAKHEGYVPHGVVPGEYGDYVDLQINKDGRITNWPAKPRLDIFFGDEDDQ